MKKIYAVLLIAASLLAGCAKSREKKACEKMYNLNQAALGGMKIDKKLYLKTCQEKVAEARQHMKPEEFNDHLACVEQSKNLLEVILCETALEYKYHPEEIPKEL